MEGYFAEPEGPGLLGEKKEADGLKGWLLPISIFREEEPVTPSPTGRSGRNSSDCFIIFDSPHLHRKPFCLTRKEFLTLSDLCRRIRN
jgi:hypothetical protein